jgi:hypothetical protein
VISFLRFFIHEFCIHFTIKLCILHVFPSCRLGEYVMKFTIKQFCPFRYFILLDPDISALCSVYSVPLPTPFALTGQLFL